MSIPDFLHNKLLNSYGEELTNRIEDVYSLSRVTSIRVNTLKTDINNVKNKFDELNIKYKEVDILPFALIIEGGEDIITNTDLYKNGEIYLQSLSSMLPPLYMDLNSKATILDMAASPGGKTSEMCALSNNEIFITATEINPIRLERLKFNLDKLGCKNVTTMKKDASSLDEYFIFDGILLDSPCSGSGTIENNDFSKITEELVNKIQNVQYRLLKKAISILKSGSTMIYSTCSILKEENEEIVKRILKEENVTIVPIDIDVETLPSTLEGVITVMPSKEYEGFFVCKLKKN